MSVVTATDSRWFRELAPDSGDRPLLVCLPYAGGGASIYRTWSTLFAGEFHVAAVQLPGRETRVQETPEVDVESIATAIAARVEGRPYVLFGHSMGGRIAFEVTRILEQRGADLPGLAVISAARPPHTLPDGPLDQISNLPDARLVARLRRSGSVPDAVLDEPELLDLFLPVFRADFTWVDQTAEAGLDPERAPTPVAAPVLSLAGTFDEVATFEQVGQWDRWTTAGHRGQVLPGGHFFLDEQANAVREAIIEAWRDLVVANPTDGADDGAPAEHHVTVGSMRLWRDGMLRTTMLAADELDRLADPELAQLADRSLTSGAGGTAARAELEGRLAEPDQAVAAICAEPLFREAVVWQNPGLLGNIDKLANGQSKQASRRRYREATAARYWQRYGAKNENIGFFGPTTWITLDPSRPHTVARPGEQLTRDRRTFLEPWAVRAVADALCSPWDIRRLLVPERSPLARFDLAARRAARPPRAAVDLTPRAAELLATVDGRRSAERVLAAADLEPDAGQEELARLHDEGWLRWDADIPPTPDAEHALSTRLAALPDEPAVRAARRQWGRLLEARDRLQAVAGDVEAVIRAAGELEAVFTEISSQGTHRHPGEMYAGRGVYYEDTQRDLDVVIGADVLEPLAEVLPLLARSARWLSAELVDAYDEALLDLVEDLAEGGSDVDFAQVWFFARGMLFGDGERPVDAVAERFADRWAQVLQLPEDDRVEVALDPAEFRERVLRVFPWRRCEWSAARVHSPDVQVVARSVEEINRGEAEFVVGEMHTAWATLDVAALTIFHADPDALGTALERDCGERRVRLALPESWPRAGTRTTQSLRGSRDVDLVFEDRPGVDPDRRIGVAELVVRNGSDGWRVHPLLDRPDAPTEGWTMAEVFSDLLAVHAVDAFKLLSPQPYTPRVRVGRTMLHRRTWRMTIADTGMASGKGIAAAMIAARRLRERLGLPEQVYVGIQGEVKPVYCDLRSRSYVQAVCTMIRSAASRGSVETTVMISEALPAPDQAWVPTPDGRACLSEIRLQIVDDEGAND